MVEQIANSNAVARSEYDAVKVLPKEPKGLASGTPAKPKPKTIVLLWECKEHLLNPDAEGRYSLTHLWDAAGHEMKHRPSYWMENLETKQLVAEYDLKAGIPALKVVRGGRGNNRGTWAIEPMIYAYAR